MIPKSSNLLWVLVVEALYQAFVLKEVIQPQVPLGLPCYDFTPVINHKVVSDLPKVSLPTSFAANSHGVTGDDPLLAKQVLSQLSYSP